MSDSILRLPSADAPCVLAILDGRPAIVLDEWRNLADDEALPSPDEAPAVIVGPQRYAEARAAGLRVGLRVPGDAEPEGLLGDAHPELVAIEVPKFTDGRHYSLARLLREREGFTGELRAFGDVLPDQLFYMRRCGYTSFELKAGKSLATGLRTLQAFTVTYQGAVDEPRPLYRRRA